MTVFKPHLYKNLLGSAFVSLMLLPGQAHAIETLVKGAPANVNPIRTPRPDTGIDSPLTVKSVIVDQTAENAVAARDKALKAAPRLAFQKLVEQNMSPEEAKNFKYPDDKTIAALVQDFEVKNEQLSATRYVASYNVRFSDAVRRYVTIRQVQIVAPGVASSQTSVQTFPQASAGMSSQTDIPQTGAPAPAVPQVKTIDSVVQEQTSSLPPQMAGGTATQTGIPPQAAPQQQPLAAAPAVPQRRRHLLVLPYYEDAAGRTVLWEEDNPWRLMWQRNEQMADNAAVNFIVPLGDITDVSAGNSNAVWSGDYRAVERLQKNYGADEVVLPVAKKTGNYVTVDMYFFRNGKLDGRQVLQPYVGDKSEAAALDLGLQTSIAYLQNPPPKDSEKKNALLSVSRDLMGTPYERPAMNDGVGTVVISSSKTTRMPQPGVASSAPAPTSVPVGPVSAAPLPFAAQSGAPGASDAIGPTEIDAHMDFGNFGVWSDFQRRLTTMMPQVILDLQSLSGDGADFKLRYGGSLPSLQNALRQKGIDLVSLPSGTGQPIYGVKLVN